MINVYELVGTPAVWAVVYAILVTLIAALLYRILPKEGRGAIPLCTFLLSLFGFFFVWSGTLAITTLAGLIIDTSAPGWPVVTGRIVGINTTHVESRSARPDVYRHSVSYSYDVGGKTYYGNQGMRDDAQKLNSGVLSVYYSSGFPFLSTYAPGFHLDNLALMLAYSLGMLAAGALCSAGWAWASGEARIKRSSPKDELQ